MSLLSRRATLLGFAGCALPLASRAAEPGTLTFAELYDTTPTGISFSPKVRTLSGASIGMRGYMAPPLKAESDFFVLTRFPMSVCPFCSSEADWPSDIVVVYLSASAQVLQPSQLIRVSGRLESGAWMDPKTAFVSMVRIVEAEWKVA